MVETGKRSRHHRDNHNHHNNNGGHRNQRRRIERDDRMEGGDELVAYRILCPDTVIGSVIGKSGKVINSIRVESRAKVKVVDPFPGAKDRVITIYCFVKEKAEVGLDEEYNDNKPLCPSQDALMRTHAAIADAVASLRDPERNHGNREECTILVPASQSANIIGKGGSNIKKLRMMTRANIKVIPKDVGDPMHSCAMDFDNFVQINGDSEAVKKALFAVSAIIYKFPPKEEIPLDTNVSEIPPSIIIPADMPIYPASGYFGGPDPMVPPRSAAAPLMDAHPPELPVPGYADAGGMWPVVLPSYGGAARSEELTIRVLCPSDKIGRVIGRGGSVIKSVRQASGAHIQVDDAKVDKDKCDECVIIVTTTEALDDVQSKAVEAVLLLQEKINEDAQDVTFRFLVPSRNIGCIIGKGGSIINEIRKRSGAHIRISKGEKPKYVDPSDEYIEVSGDVKNVRDALIQLVLRLRDDALNDKDGSSKPVGAAEPLYGGGQGLSVPPLLPPVPPVKPMGYEPITETGGGLGMLSSSGLYKYGSYSLEGPKDMWGMQNFDKPEPTKGGYRMDDDYGSAYPSNMYGGLLPSSTLEILIPANAVGKVIGKSGANIANIRQISGAVIEISEPKSSRGDRIAHISGTPEQKRSAENLIQAFIMAT